MITRTLISVFALLCLTACDAKEDAAKPSAQSGTSKVSAPDDHGHDHSDRTALGKVELGGLAIEVFHIGAITPGKEADFDLDFAAGAKLPSAVRGWIGVESGQGSMRMRFEKETETRMHGHVEVPQPLPEGSKLWLEVDGTSGPQSASVALQR